MSKHSTTRRRFLGASAQTGLMGALSALGLAGVAAPARAAVTDYKALVCLYMFGGNDGNNMIVPLDSTRYAQYNAIRGSHGLALSNAAKTLLAARSATVQATDHPVTQPFGFHYGMPELDALYGQGQVAAILNVGSLRQPLSKAQYLAGSGVPAQLFSHPDQTIQNQAGTPSSAATGWGDGWSMCSVPAATWTRSRSAPAACLSKAPAPTAICCRATASSTWPA
ncbi:DUF1501 domain-containing protein [Duganella sp. HH101]|uniref:DUF1501 domain-containing protein n=1 Tax=Duganella sp. HH101 TaxID=1781066 RepID=UPI0008933736|nr:DUF1501 domain-containing protein [Duganella sp. HH101]OEZ97581.1 hypothetical protein DUGA2_59200 [Duganella sp. HH101]